MSVNQDEAPAYCIFLATSSICQGFYVIASSVTTVLWVVIITVKNDHPIDVVMRWDTYIVQDWGDCECSNGTRVDHLHACHIAFGMYKDTCGSMDEDIDAHMDRDSPPGCQVEKNLAISNFHFNRNLRGSPSASYAPVCNVSRTQQLKCYDESRQGVLDTVGAAAFFLSFIPAIVMGWSRFCAPCFYKFGEGDMLGCVPCNCFAQLDTPYVIAGGIMFVVGSTLGAQYDGVFGPAPLAWLLGVVLNAAALVVAFTKLCIMSGGCYQVCKPSHRVVVGHPMQVDRFAPNRQARLDGAEVVIGQTVTAGASTSPKQ